MRLAAVLRLAAVMAVIHFALVAVSFAVGFSSTMERFDSAVQTDGSAAEAAANYVVRVLAQPGLAAWDLVNSNRTAPRLVQWVVILGNSAIWGLLLAALGAAKRERWAARCGA